MPRALRSLKHLPNRLFSALSSPWLGTITGVKTQQKVANLSFDDGPHESYTPRLLDLLASYKAKASFFMVGEAAQRQPDLVKRIQEEGHSLGNHSFDHPSMLLLSSSERKEQVLRCAKALGNDHRHFRPPYGNQSITSRWEMTRLGYQVIAWSYHCLDWVEQDPKRIAERLLTKLRPGSIILLHDALYKPSPGNLSDRGPMLEALRLVFEQSEYSFVNLPELLSYGPSKKRLWIKTTGLKDPKE